MTPALRLLSSSVVLLVLTAVIFAEKPATPLQRRLEKIQSRIDAFQGLDTVHVVIANAEASDVIFYTREDTVSAWQAWSLAPGQTAAFPLVPMIGLFTQNKDTAQEALGRTYALEGGNKYVIYWNQEFWDLIRVGSPTATMK